MKKKIFIIGGVLLGLIIIFFAVVLIFGKSISLEEPAAALDIQKGSAEVNGRIVKTGTNLKQGDIIKTGKDSLAVINFYDKSSSRIDENSEITITKLSTSNEGANTQVGIKVTLGHIWSRVVKLVDKESKFEVETPTTVATVRGTAFDINVDSEGKESMVVTENIIRTAVKKQGEKGGFIAKTDILQGDMTSIDGKNLPSNPSALLGMVKKAEEEIKSEWIIKNLDQDKKFEEDIAKKEAENIKEKAGITADSSLYTLKSLAQSVRLATTFSKQGKTDLEIEYANQKLAEAGKLISEGKNEIAKNAIDEYSAKIENIVKNIDNLKQDKNLSKIRENLQEKVIAQKNLVATTLPDSPLYNIKQKIEETLGKTAISDTQKIEFQLDQARERLKEAKKLMEENKGDIAKKTLEKYGKVYEQVQIQATEIAKTNQTEIINNILNQASEKTIESQMFLKTMENIAPPEIKQKIIEQKIKGMDEARKMMENNPEKFKEFQKEIIRNGATTIPQEFIDQGIVPPWLKDVESIREHIKSEIMKNLPAGVTLPADFVIPDFGTTFDPSAGFDYTQFIPAEFANLPVPPTQEEIQKMIEQGTPPPEGMIPPGYTPPTNIPDDTTTPPSGDTTTPPSGDPNEIMQIVIGPSTASIKSGAVMFFKAIAVYGDGHTQDVSSTATWTVNYDSGTGVIDPGGRFIAGGIGTVTISATYNGKVGTSGAITITGL